MRRKPGEIYVGADEDREEDAEQPRYRIELRPETWTHLIIAVTRPPAGPDPGTLPGSGP